MKRTLTFLLLVSFLANFQTSYGQWVETSEIITPTFTNNCVAYNGKVYFTGGAQTQFVTNTTYNNKVDVLDLETGEITTLPQGISVGRCGMMCAAYDGKLYFAGGFRWVSNVAGMTTYKVVDIYDVANDSWSTKELSISRGWGAVAVVDGKIMFAGGYHSTGTTVYPSDVVDIYDPVDTSWTVGHLSQARAEFEAGVIGNKVWFCGGSTSWTVWQVTNRVDVYDADANLWSIDSLSLARSYSTVAAVDPYVLCAGGYTPTAGYSDRVDIFNTETGLWDADTLSAPRFGIAAATLGCKAYFTGGGHIDLAISYYDASTNRVDIFDADGGTWSTGTMQKNRMTHACAAWGDKIAVGGGWRAAQTETTGSVEILTADTSCFVFASERVFQGVFFSISPNPATDFLTINFADFPTQKANVLLRIFNHLGNEIWRKELPPGDLKQPIRVDLAGFSNGTYWLKMEVEGQLYKAQPFSVFGK